MNRSISSKETNMGRGSYTAGDWAALRKSRSLTDSSTAGQIFTRKSALSVWDSRNVLMRESCDSPDSPASTPVMIGFDVTASMGYLARELAAHAVNQTVLSLLEEKPISDPQILCSAIGDARSDRSPLQVTQFESDIRIIRQLTDLYMEGGGGGNNGESYHLLWYFAAKHTKTDAWDKRHEKGFLFTIGDDRCHESLGVSEIRRIFGDTADYSLSNEELLRMAGERYCVSHIHIDTEQAYNDSVFQEWLRLMPGSAARIHKRDINLLPELLTSIIRVKRGEAVNRVLADLPAEKAERLAGSMAMIEAAALPVGREKAGRPETLTF